MLCLSSWPCSKDVQHCWDISTLEWLRLAVKRLISAMDMSGARAGQIATSIALLAAYLTLNSSLNLLNR